MPPDTVIDAELVPSTTLDTAPTLPVKVCRFQGEHGETCSNTKVRARGYCDRHYKALERRGAFVNTPVYGPSNVPTNPQTIRRNLRIIQKAQRSLMQSAPTFVDDLIRGSRIAADNGKTDPAQWALLHTRVLEPIANKNSDSKGSNITVNVGVKLAGQE